MTRTVCGRCEMDKCQCKTIGATGMTYEYTAYVSSGNVNSAEEVLRVTAEGEFIWNENADEMIESGDYSQYPALRHVLKALRENDRLREALDNLIAACELPGAHCEVEQALPHAKAALRREGAT